MGEGGGWNDCRSDAAAERALDDAHDIAAVLDTSYVRGVQSGIEFSMARDRGDPVTPEFEELAESNVQVRMALALDGESVDTSLARGALGMLDPRGLAGRMIAVLAAPLALAADDPELARIAMEAMRELEGGFAVVPPGAAFLGSIRQRLGYCHLALGDPEAACDAFAMAAARDREIGAVAAQGRLGCGTSTT